MFKIKIVLQQTLQIDVKKMVKLCQEWMLDEKHFIFLEIEGWDFN